MKWRVNMNRREILGVVFDMDGLMFDSERIVQYSWNIAGERMGYGPLGDHIYHTLGLNRKTKYVRANGLPTKKGLHELLDFLRKEQIPMAVATSSSQEHAVGNLEKEGIREYFQTVITGNMVSRAKPDPEIYLKACRGLKLPPSKVLALEDSYNGLRSAHQAGMITVMVPDLLRDSACVDNILDGKMESLLEVRNWIASMR